MQSYPWLDTNHIKTLTITLEGSRGLQDIHLLAGSSQACLRLQKRRLTDGRLLLSSPPEAHIFHYTAHSLVQRLVTAPIQLLPTDGLIQTCILQIENTYVYMDLTILWWSQLFTGMYHCTQSQFNKPLLNKYLSTVTSDNGYIFRIMSYTDNL